MDEQKRTIKVRLNGKETRVSVPMNDPDTEEFARRSAAVLNKKIEDFHSMYPTKDMADILALIAFNTEISRLRTVDELKKRDKALESLKNDMDSYIDNIDKAAVSSF